tara:strand:- start:529 stop:903 length:375 start_codon:yes stop_codon:yes gene_type:complete
MAKLAVNFDDVPDVVLPVPGGEYELEIFEAPQLMENANKTGMKVVFGFRVINNEEHNNRKLYDHVSVKMETRLKRIAKSAGLSPGSDGIELDDLNMCVVRALVIEVPYEERMVNRIKDYLFDEE